MAYQTRKRTEPLIIRTEAGKLVLPTEVAAKIENFIETSEGTLRSIHGPAPLVPKDAEGDFPAIYGLMHGIFHATMQGGAREVLLLHTGPNIIAFRGWKPSDPWDTLVGEASKSPQIVAELSNDSTPQFPTQFERTPRGVVIVPQGGRAYIYDGTAVHPLGYDTAPAAPIGYGPETEDDASPNAKGFSVDRAAAGWTLHADFGYGRLGTIQVNEVTNAVGKASLLEGMYQGALQWVDVLGNLSPISPRSNAIHFFPQQVDNAGDTAAQVEKEVYWGNISTGRNGTAGRILLRTKDTKNKGSIDLFVVPGNAGAGVFGNFATIPDNTATAMPDNVPDGWLVAPPIEPIPVPTFKLCRLALGRLWIANTQDDPSVLIPSLPGRFGTFAVDTDMYPDPAGGEITGLWGTDEGLLVFTSMSTFLVMANNQGDGFRVVTINATKGCIAPSSFANLPDGSTIWLGLEGFYRYRRGEVTLLSEEISPLTNKINLIRARHACAAYDPVSREYRCWVHLDNYGGTGNNRCLIYHPSSEGWREREHEHLKAVCTTNDHRKQLLGAGQMTDAGANADGGVWVLDHEVSTYSPKTVTSTIETSWIQWSMSSERKTAKTVYLNFRETENASATIEVYRDWRMGSTPIYTDTTNATLYSPEDIPPLWDTTAWDATDAEWVRRRPYWKRVDIDIPSCEVYKIVITTNSRCEFLGLMIDEEPKVGSRARTP